MDLLNVIFDNSTNQVSIPGVPSVLGCIGFSNNQGLVEMVTPLAVPASLTMAAQLRRP